MTILVILESPSKAPKISKYLKSLGYDAIVRASYGHVSDLDKKTLSIDVNNRFKPKYGVSLEKKKVISDLRMAFKKCDSILLGCDFDREGEAIAWHVSEQLKVPRSERKRLLFTEITKPAIKKAMENPKDLDMNMFYAQQARRIIDRLIGYKITPLLWSNIQNTMKKGISLSAGRVQSVVNKLIIEREKEIEKFSLKSYYKTVGKFILNKNKLVGDLNVKLEDKDKVYDLLEKCANAEFKVGTIKKMLSKRNPSAPFITSTIQQEASSKFRIGPKKLMMILQQLYEGGLITYMRTDSTLLSEEVLDEAEKIIKEKYGEKYSNRKQYTKKSKNSQEAHEAIRPTDLSVAKLEQSENYTFDHVKIYNLIYNRTIASQMAPAKIQNITINVNIYEDQSIVKDYWFISKNQKVLFDGFTAVYSPYKEDDDEEEKQNKFTGSLKENDVLSMKIIDSTEKFTKPPHLRYTEASLIKKLDELGIGRPSTYSSMVTTVQDRKYVELKDKEGENKQYDIIKLEDFTIEEKSDKIKVNGEKNKLMPTNIGEIVNKFLCENFDNILNYNFTAKIEENLDLVAQGKKDWVNLVNEVYKSFNPIVLKLSKSTSLEKNNYSRVLGKDPKTQFEIVTYIAKYGPVVQLKNPNNAKDSKFAPLKDIKMEEVTLEQALELLKYPYVWGRYKDKEVHVCKGKYGVYLKYNGKNVSLYDTLEKDITEEKLAKLLAPKKTFDGGSGSSSGSGSGSSSGVVKKLNNDITIMNGKYGPYINYKSKYNVKIYSKKKLDELTIEDCKEMINKKFKK